MTKKILLVDDDVSVLFAYGSMLRRERYEVDTVGNIKYAYELLRRNAYDVAILDLNLCSGGCEEGFELLRFIKSAHLVEVVIIVTANSTNDVRERAYTIGANHFFEKPVSLMRIQKAISES